MGKPKIRFKGYEDAWEQRKLEEYLGVSKEKNRDESFGKDDVLSVSGEYGIVNQIEFQGRSFAGASVANYGVVEGGDVVYTKSPLKSNPYGIIKTNKGKTGIVSTLYAVYKPKNNVGAEFVQIYFELDSRMNSYMHPLVNKGAKNDMKVSDENALKGSVIFPKIDEQKAISKYFAHLDHLITLHQRKCEETKSLKKYMLQKMFPENGKCVPEIRFSGFSDAWEQRKVSELLQERNEQAPMSEEYPLMAFIANQGVAPKGDRYDRSALVNDETGKKYKRTEFGDFIYSSNNLETGSIGLNKYGNACISPVYSIFKPTGKADLDFLGRRFLRKDFINEMVKWRQGVVYGQWKIHETDFLNIVVTVPTIEEQKRIGDFLDGLDSLITLHQHKCDELQKLKKFMLQNMFV